MKLQAYQGRKLSSLTLGVIIVGSVGLALMMPEQLKDAVSYVVYPLLHCQRACIQKVHSLVEKRATIADLKQQIEVLQEQNTALLAQVIEREGIKHYAQGVDELLAFKRRYELNNACCAQVLARTLSDQAHYFLVGAGRLQGVEVDMIALYNNVLVGRVVEVYPHYSKVVLTSDRDCKVAVYCAGTQASGIHEGCNSVTQSQLSRISHLEAVNVDDLVISSGQGVVFPQGFALGRVTTVERNGLFYSISIEPLLDVTKLQYCMLISREAITA